MSSLSPSFDELIEAANQATLRGWDFSFLANRWVEEPLSWDFRATIKSHLSADSRLIDMGTDGGEFLLSLAPLPAQTVATEGYAPNVSVAQANLESHEVKVVNITEGPLLPFEDNCFDVVMNRHEKYEPTEVLRVLETGGTFITQQVGGRDMLGLNQLLKTKSRFTTPTGTKSSR